MGELVDYYIILSTVDYDNDPCKYGRIKCTIPGVIHSDTSTEEAMPWVRPFKMYGYQTFCRPIVGQKIWVLVSKSNYNELWWFPFFETTELVQNYLNENYDNQPDVLHSRMGSTESIFTYDNLHGYMMKLGEDYINMKPNRDIIIAGNNSRMKIEGDKVYCGHGDGTRGEYEPCVLGDQCSKMRAKISGLLSRLSGEIGVCTDLLGSPAPQTINEIAKEIKENILAENTFIN